MIYHLILPFLPDPASEGLDMLKQKTLVQRQLLQYPDNNKIFLVSSLNKRIFHHKIYAKIMPYFSFDFPAS